VNQPKLAVLRELVQQETQTWRDWRTVVLDLEQQLNRARLSLERSRLHTHYLVNIAQQLYGEHCLNDLDLPPDQPDA
jgi:hypothetical protein